MRFQGDGFLEMMDRLAEKAAPYEKAGIGAMRLGAFGVAFERTLIAGDRLIVLSLHLQNRAETGMSAGKSRIAFQCLPVACRCRVLLALRVKNIADAAMCPGAVRLEPQRFLETSNRLVVAAAAA